MVLSTAREAGTRDDGRDGGDEEAQGMCTEAAALYATAVRACPGCVTALEGRARTHVVEARFNLASGDVGRPALELAAAARLLRRARAASVHPSMELHWLQLGVLEASAELPPMAQRLIVITLIRNADPDDSLIRNAAATATGMQHSTSPATGMQHCTSPATGPADAVVVEAAAALAAVRATAHARRRAACALVHAHPCDWEAWCVLGRECTTLPPLLASEARQDGRLASAVMGASLPSAVLGARAPLPAPAAPPSQAPVASCGRSILKMLIRNSQAPTGARDGAVGVSRAQRSAQRASSWLLLGADAARRGAAARAQHALAAAAAAEPGTAPSAMLIYAELAMARGEATVAEAAYSQALQLGAGGSGGGGGGGGGGGAGVGRVASACGLAAHLGAHVAWLGLARASVARQQQTRMRLGGGAGQCFVTGPGPSFVTGPSSGVSVAPSVSSPSASEVSSPPWSTFSAASPLATRAAASPEAVFAMVSRSVELRVTVDGLGDLARAALAVGKRHVAFCAAARLVNRAPWRADGFACLGTIHTIWGQLPQAELRLRAATALRQAAVMSDVLSAAHEATALADAHMGPTAGPTRGVNDDGGVNDGPTGGPVDVVPGGLAVGAGGQLTALVQLVEVQLALARVLARRGDADDELRALVDKADATLSRAMAEAAAAAPHKPRGFGGRGPAGAAARRAPKSGSLPDTGDHHGATFEGLEREIAHLRRLLEGDVSAREALGTALGAKDAATMAATEAAGGVPSSDELWKRAQSVDGSQDTVAAAAARRRALCRLAHMHPAALPPATLAEAARAHGVVLDVRRVRFLCGR